jgi:hypothetical protein
MCSFGRHGTPLSPLNLAECNVIVITFRRGVNRRGPALLASRHSGASVRR